MREEEVSSPIQGVGGPRVLALSHERASGDSSVKNGGVENTRVTRLRSVVVVRPPLRRRSSTSTAEKHKKGSAKLVLTSCTALARVGERGHRVLLAGVRTAECAAATATVVTAGGPKGGARGSIYLQRYRRRTLGASVYRLPPAS